MDNLPADPFTEDETDAIVITHRIANDNGNRTSLADVLDAFGLSLDDLDHGDLRD